MGTTGNYISIMIDGLKKKIIILNQILGLTNKEKELLQVEPFSMNDFDTNMKEKSTLVEQLVALDNGFTTVFNRVKMELGTDRSLYENQINQMKLLISKITELSVKIQSQEVRNKELARKQFGNVKKELVIAKRSGQMASNYYKSMSMVDTEPQFLDKKK